MQRRQFFRDSLLVAAGVTAPRLRRLESSARQEDPRLRVGLAAYSFRQSFGWMQGKQQRVAGRLLDMSGFIDLCAEHNCAAELTSYYFKGNADNDYYLGLRRHAFARGVAISGTAVGNNFALPRGEARDQQIAEVKAWIDRAAVLGAPHVRVFAGAASGIEEAAARELCVAALEECSDYAGQKGIFVGLENHGGIVATAAGMLEIVTAVKSPWFGVNLDTGNFHTEDPYGDLAKCARFAVNVQFKVEMRAKGQQKNAPADLDRLIKILRAADYQGYFVLEYEAAGDSWREVPRHLDAMRKAIG